MSTGPIKPFIDYSANTGGDDGQNTAASIQPFSNGEFVEQVVLQRTPENLRQRTENVRDLADDLLYWANADRMLAIGGPGLVTWPGSTTVAASGIPTISDTLYIMPFLTPGAAQTPPVPPVASAYGTLTLQRAGATPGITVASNRRSYAGGDKINIAVVFGGGAGTCSAQVSDDPERTVVLTANTPTLTTVIAVLTGIMVDSPAVQLVTATLAGGAAGTDLLLTPQAAQYITGNYDGEGHAITTAALAAFFAANPTSALAEGDTLCLQYASMVEDGALGGRRQSVPENSNTAMPSGSFFNSRVHPERLTNAIPICKVINNRLVFINGDQLESGATGIGLGLSILPLDNTFTGTNTFTKRMISSNAGSTEADAARELTVAPGATYKPIDIIRAGAGGSRVRTYAATSLGPPQPGYCITVNAKWDPAALTWSADDAAKSSTYYGMSTEDIFIKYKGFGAAPWADGAWDLAPFTLDLSAQSAVYPGPLTVSGELQADGLVNGTGFVPLNGTIAGRVCMYTTNADTFFVEPFGLIIGGALYQTPTAGLTMGGFSWAVSSRFYVYAYVAGGTVNVTASATVPDPLTGYRTQTGDSTRVYLGTIYTTPAGGLKAFRRVDRHTVFLNDTTATSGSFGDTADNGIVATVSANGTTTIDISAYVPSWIKVATIDGHLNATAGNSGGMELQGLGVTATKHSMTLVASGINLNHYIYGMEVSLSAGRTFDLFFAEVGTALGYLLLNGYED